MLPYPPSNQGQITNTYLDSKGQEQDSEYGTVALIDTKRGNLLRNGNYVRMISAVCRGERTSGGEHRLGGMQGKLTPLLALFIISVNSGWKLEMNLFSVFRAL